MFKKIAVVLSVVLLLAFTAGCTENPPLTPEGVSTAVAGRKLSKAQADVVFVRSGEVKRLYIVVDPETKVQYFWDFEHGGMCPRLDSDGTPMLFTDK